MQKLYELTRKGGLALPNVELYNIAFERISQKLAKHWAMGNLIGCESNPILHHSRVVVTQDAQDIPIQTRLCLYLE